MPIFEYCCPFCRSTVERVRSYADKNKPVLCECAGGDRGIYMDPVEISTPGYRRDHTLIED